MLTRRDRFLFTFTFIVGLATGIFLYFTSFLPFYPTDTGIIDTQEASEAFSVTGRSYGGLSIEDYVHPSFRVTSNGSYSFLRGGVNVEGQNPETGTLPRDLFNNLENAVERADLEVLSQPDTKEECNTFIDASDYVYRITIEGVQYDLDTCTSNISYDHELVIILEDVWIYMLDPESYQQRPQPQQDEETAAGFFESLLRSYFVPDEDEPEDTDESVACTLEAKICPDGSAVGRTGPNCEFAACPGEEN